MSRLAIWVALVGVALTLLASYGSWNRANEAVEAELANTGAVLTGLITDAVDGVSDQLVAVAGLYHSSEDVTRIEFARFVINLGVEPGVIGIAYAPILKPDEVDEFVAGVRPLIPDYEVFEYTVDGARVPARLRDRYVPLQWSQPDRAFDGPYGFDMASVPVLADALSEAGDDLTAVATPFMQLPGETDEDSFVIFSPVTHVGTPTVKGFTIALIDLSEFLEGRLPAVWAESVTWQIFGAESEVEIPDGWWTGSFEVVGEEWRLAVAGNRGSVLSPDFSSALLILAAGVFASLLAAHGISEYRHRAHARSEVEHLREMARAKDQFLASVGHELRTPLTGVVGFTELLRESGRDIGEDDKRKMIDSIASEAGDLSAIIDDLLVAARSELDMVTVTAELVDLRSLVEGVAASVRDEKVSHLVLVGPDDGWLALGDPGRVRQVVRNLIVNACRHGGDRIEVRVSPDDDLVRLQVADPGPPLPDAERERIFEVYHAVHRVETKPATLGIGLSVSRHLSRLMGGDLTYRHEDGWNVFALTLPAPDIRQARESDELVEQAARS